MTALLYLDDLSAGMKFTGGPLTITAAEIKAFAAQFDPQPFHLDDAAAEASFFQGLAASGWHTASLGMRLLVTGGPRLAGGYIGAGGELVWTQPVYAGDSLTMNGEIVEVKPSRSRPDRGIVTVRCETFNQKGEVVQKLLARLMVPRRPAAA
ncbi:MAG: MaoC family dehydratase [Pseudomonadota bacterium]